MAFVVDTCVLDPRPDSETLVEAALARLGSPEAPHRLLDLGVGSGCLLLALLSELPNATGVGLDLSPDAVRCARDNAVRLGLADRTSWLAGDWGEALCADFDLILANPPYIPEALIEELDPEVALHDPRLALAGGDDGLSAFRVLAPNVKRLLKPDGLLVLECGFGQASEVAAILHCVGLSPDETLRDLSGIERCIIASLEV